MAFTGLAGLAVDDLAAGAHAGRLLQEHRLDAGGEAELGQLRVHLLVRGVMVQQLQRKRHRSDRIATKITTIRSRL